MSTADPKQLRALAALLDCSSDAFTDAQQLPEDLDELVELFDLWLRIDTQKSRLRLLFLARELAQGASKRDSEVADRPGSSH